jgi:hypothetical protein
MPTIEYDEKGKYYTDVVTKVALPATIQTANQLIRGFVYVRHGQRIKDELDNEEAFIAVTTASILDADGKVQFEAPFIAVRREQIVWVMPDEEAVQEDEQA